MSDPIQEREARLGEPSYRWRAGQERRLQMILSAAEGRQRGWVFDNGCGLGLYLQRLAAQAERAYGLELDRERARTAGRAGLAVVSAEGEQLPFPQGVFDLVLSHEVLEHVTDDRAALAEMVRTLRGPGERGPGRLVLFTPNRGYPFETHGIYFRGRYRFGNIPLVNYLPGGLRNRLAPHVRVYSGQDLQRLIRGLPLRVVQRTIVFGAYDNLIERWGLLGRALRGVLQALERTPLRVLGLSHLWVLERT
jgi:SAM-dependent methyltransferase